uniref:Soldier-caste specific protein 1 n=1 Tax=Hodotermopsis japonicus TaxID=62959 RepID=Q9U5D9_HODJA|nr:soldier-caste specific protein 1 [Hodotermopsis japonica]
MMTKSLYAVAVFLIAIVIVADAECEVGPVKDVHFEMDKFLGKWCWIYHEPNDVEKNIGCIKDSFQQSNTLTFFTNTSFYNESTKEIQSAIYTVPHWNSTSFTQDPDSDGAIWTSTFFFVSLDYKKYAALKYCLKGWDKPVTLIGFRRCDPDEHTIKEAKDSLDANGGRSDTLLKYKYCDCLKDL